MHTYERANTCTYLWQYLWGHFPSSSCRLSRYFLFLCHFLHILFDDKISSGSLWYLWDNQIRRHSLVGNNFLRKRSHNVKRLGAQTYLFQWLRWSLRREAHVELGMLHRCCDLYARQQKPCFVFIFSIKTTEAVSRSQNHRFTCPRIHGINHISGILGAQRHTYAFDFIQDICIHTFSNKKGCTAVVMFIVNP